MNLPSTDDPIARELLREAYQYAADNSDDIHTQVGAVVAYGDEIVSRGANRIPSLLLPTADRLERPRKYMFLEHAERDALAHAHPVFGATMYAPWAACADCARAIVNRGIDRVVTHKQIMDSTPDRWMDSILAAEEMFAEAGIIYQWYDGKIGDCSVLFNGETWEP